MTAVRPMNTNGQQEHQARSRWRSSAARSTRACDLLLRGRSDGSSMGTVACCRPGALLDITASPSKPELRLSNGIVKNMAMRKSTMAITQAEPVSNRWKPRL